MHPINKAQTLPMIDIIFGSFAWWLFTDFVVRYMSWFLFALYILLNTDPLQTGLLSSKTYYSYNIWFYMQFWAWSSPWAFCQNQRFLVKFIFLDLNGRKVYMLTQHSTSYYRWIITGCAIAFALLIVAVVVIVCYCRNKKIKKEKRRYINPSSYDDSGRLPGYQELE